MSALLLPFIERLYNFLFFRLTSALRQAAQYAVIAPGFNTLDEIHGMLPGGQTCTYQEYIGGPLGLYCYSCL